MGDQFILTPEGEEAPSLTDVNFPQMGRKRYKRIGEYMQEMEDCQSGFKVGPTYSFGFWGNARFLDVLKWKVVGIPVATPLDFNQFAGAPPVYAVLYSLEPTKGGDSNDARHLQSRKKYYFRAAIWSSNRRPDRDKFEKLTGASMQSVSSLEPLKKSVRRRVTSYLKKSILSCTARGE